MLCVCVVQMARIKGVKGAQEERVREIQRELQGELYRDIATRHKGMLVTLKVCDSVCVCVCVCTSSITV